MSSTALADAFDPTWLNPPIRAALALTDAGLVIGTLISAVVFCKMAQLPVFSSWHGTPGKVGDKEEGFEGSGTREKESESMLTIRRGKNNEREYSRGSHQRPHSFLTHPTPSNSFASSCSRSLPLPSFKA